MASAKAFYLKAIVTAQDKLSPALKGIVKQAETADVFSQLWLDICKDMTEQAGSAARMCEITLAQVMPAQAVTYGLYENAACASEIVECNQILNPPFSATEPLRVLTQ